MNNYYFLFYFFDNPIIRWVRVSVFLLIGILFFINLQNPKFIISFLPLYFVLILQEFFIHFKLEKAVPQKTVNDEKTHPIYAVDFRARSLLERKKDVNKVINDVKNDHEIKYFLNLLDIVPTFSSQISEDDLLRKASTIVMRVGGRNIHPVDLLASYLLIQDETDKSLFNLGLTDQDIINVLSWSRKIFRIDLPKHHGLHFTGNGVFDFFIYGWSAELTHYASNFTQEVLSGLHPEPIGRDREYDLLVTALSKSSSSNAIILGNPGVGKTTLISQLALDSNLGNLPKSVNNKIVFKLFPERLLSGVENQGDLEARLVNLMSELFHAGNIIIYIPNIENIFGGGGLNMDLSGVLSEYLKSNRIKVIGSTTQASYKQFIYTKQEAKDLFDVIEMEEPKDDSGIFMLLAKSEEIERLNRVKITYLAIKNSLKLSDSYLNDGTVLPGRAVKLLEDSVSYGATHGQGKITEKVIEEFVQTKTKIVLSDPTKEESTKLLNLETDIHKRVIAQDEAVRAIADAMRRVRSGMQNENRPIASFLFLGPTGVGKTEVAKALARSYFGSEESMIRLDMTEYQSQDSSQRLIGQGGETIVDQVLNTPFVELLLDEFEKADRSVHDLFLQVLDEGRLTDNLGRAVSFKNTIIIATSNAGSEFIRESYQNGQVQGDFKNKLIEKLLETGIFKPELVNRFDEIIAFKPLEKNDVIQVAKLFLNEVNENLKEKQITLSYDDTVCAFIADNSYSVEFGARNVRRFIQQSIENQLSKLILSNELTSGSNAKITVVENNLVIGK